MDKVYRVYVHTLKSDGRKYFGVTCQPLNSRWKNGNGYKGSNNFYDAINEYGWDAFDHEVVFTTTDRTEAYNKEEELIDKYKTIDEKYGFNISRGGLHPGLNPKTVEKLVMQRKGKHFTGQALINIREAAKRRDNSVFAHPRSEETKRKISESHKGMTYGESTKQKLREAFSQPVLCIELNQTFPSMKAAAEHFGLNKCTISAVIKGRNKTAAGYHWKLL